MAQIVDGGCVVVLSYLHYNDFCSLFVMLNETFRLVSFFCALGFFNCRAVSVRACIFHMKDIH